MFRIKYSCKREFHIHIYLFRKIKCVMSISNTEDMKKLVMRYISGQRKARNWRENLLCRCENIFGYVEIWRCVRSRCSRRNR